MAKPSPCVLDAISLCFFKDITPLVFPFFLLHYLSLSILEHYQQRNHYYFCHLKKNLSWSHFFLQLSHCSPPLYRKTSQNWYIYLIVLIFPLPLFHWHALITCSSLHFTKTPLSKVTRDFQDAISYGSFSFDLPTAFGIVNHPLLLEYFLPSDSKISEFLGFPPFVLHPSSVFAGSFSVPDIGTNQYSVTDSLLSSMYTHSLVDFSQSNGVKSHCVLQTPNVISLGQTYFLNFEFVCPAGYWPSPFGYRITSQI